MPEFYNSTLNAKQVDSKPKYMEKWVKCEYGVTEEQIITDPDVCPEYCMYKFRAEWNTCPIRDEAARRAGL